MATSIFKCILDALLLSFHLIIVFHCSGMHMCTVEAFSKSSLSHSAPSQDGGGLQLFVLPLSLLCCHPRYCPECSGSRGFTADLRGLGSNEGILKKQERATGDKQSEVSVNCPMWCCPAFSLPSPAVTSNKLCEGNLQTALFNQN